MKTTVVVAVVLVIGVFAWSIANRLSADAIGMALGLGFGVLAGIPAALLVFVASRRRAPWEEEDDDAMAAHQRLGYLPYGGQSPVVIVTPGAAQQPASGAAYSGQDSYGYPMGQMQPRPALPGPSHNVGQPRVFRMIGEADEYIDE
jgi:hypothetical protein